MEIVGIVGIFIIVGIVVVVVVVLLLILLLFVCSWIKVVCVDEVFVILGCKQKIQCVVIVVDGMISFEMVEFFVMVIVNGKLLVNLIMQWYEIIFLCLCQVFFNVEVQLFDSVMLNVDGVVIVKIGFDLLYVCCVVE